MTRNRSKLLALILLAIVGGVTTYSLMHRRDEPEYRGRRLSEWLERYAGKSAGEMEAEAAIRNIGTNAVPYLLKWIAYEPPAWRITLSKLPQSIVNRWPIRGLLEDKAIRRAYNTGWGFLALGTNAVSAIPQLDVLMKDTTNPHRSFRAIRALSYIGEPAIPVLQAALADADRFERANILSAIDYAETRKRRAVE